MFKDMRKEIRFLKSIFSSKLRKTPYKLNFAITSACDSRCLTCNVGRLFQENPKVINEELTSQEITTLFENLPPTITWISFSGGEPFLRSDLLEIVSLAIKKISNLSVISIPSNGLNTGRIIKTVKKILKLNPPQLFLNFSLDGPPEIHNKIRGIKNGYKKTWRTYQSVKKLSQKHDNLHVNLEITISELNIDYLADFCERLVREREKITITIAHRGFLYKNEDNNSIILNKRALGKIKKIIQIIDRSLGWFLPPELVEKLYLKKIPQYLQNPKRQVLPCTALNASCALDSFGNITPCFIWGEVLGNIRSEKGGLLEILKKPRTKKIAEQIREGKCPNCWTPCEAYQAIIWTFITGRWYRF